MGPAVLGAAAVQVNVVVNSNFASQITDSAGMVLDGDLTSRLVDLCEEG